MQRHNVRSRWIGPNDPGVTDYPSERSQDILFLAGTFWRWWFSGFPVWWDMWYIFVICCPDKNYCDDMASCSERGSCIKASSARLLEGDTWGEVILYRFANLKPLGITRTVHPSERKIWISLCYCILPYHMVPQLFAGDDSNLDSSQVLVLSRGGQQWILQAQEVAIKNGSKDAVW